MLKMKIQSLALLIGLSLLAGYAFSESDLQVKWSYGMNKTSSAVVLGIKVADFDGDGLNDIAVAAKEDRLEGSAGWVYMLNNAGTLKWEHDTPGAITSMLVDDLSGDGKPQIMAAVSGDPPLIYFYNGAGDKKTTFINEHGYRIVSMMVDDLDNDGSKELIIGGGSLDKGKVLIYDSSGRLKYNAATTGSVSAMYISDINGDGLKEIIVGTVGRDNEYPANIQAFNSKGVSLWTYKTVKGVQVVSAWDMNGDGTKEIVAGAKDKLVILDSLGHVKEIKENMTRPGYLFNEILLADVNNDGINETILGCTNTVYLYNRNLSSLMWKNAIGPMVFDMEAVDIDGDGFLELAIASDILYVYNKDGTLVNSFNPNTPRFSVRDIYIGDINYDTYPDIIIGATDGKVYVLGSNTQSKKIDANNLYNRGKAQLTDHNYIDAQISARAAIKVYKDLGDNTKAQELNDFLKRIMNEEAGTANQTGQAQTYLDTAIADLNSSDYENAVINARIARAKYYNLNPKDDHITSLDKLINTSVESIRFQAENYLENASTYSDSKDYTNALLYAKKAADAYAFIKDDAGLSKSQAIINASKQALGVTDETTPDVSSSGSSIDMSSLMPLVIGIAALIIVALIASFFLKNRKTKKRTHPDEGNVLDKMEKERRHEKIQPKKVEMPHKEETHSQHHEKHETPKQWIREIDDAMKEPQGGEKQADENKDAHTHTNTSNKNRKKLKRIAKDNYRGAGISLRGLSHNASKESTEE